jgi:hypothetical protein
MLLLLYDPVLSHGSLRLEKDGPCHPFFFISYSSTLAEAHLLLCIIGRHSPSLLSDGCISLK